jgi:uncharacterized membrane protein
VSVFLVGGIGSVGLSAMDGLKTRSVYASAKYGKFVLSASTLVLRAVELKKNGDSALNLISSLPALALNDSTSTTIKIILFFFILIFSIFQSCLYCQHWHHKTRINGVVEH